MDLNPLCVFTGDVFCPGSYKCDTLKETSSRVTRQPVTTTDFATTTGTNTTISSNVSTYLHVGAGIYDGFFISVVNRLGAGCIPLSYVCDGEDNCKGLDDETECGNPCFSKGIRHWFLGESFITIQ